MTDKIQHSLFGLVKHESLASLASIAQRQLAAFSLEECDWQKQAQDVLDKLTDDIDLQQAPELTSEDILADIKLAEAPVVGFLCQKVMTDKCKSADPNHLKSCEDVGQKLSACIWAIVLLRYGNPQDAHAIRQALDSARLLREKHPDLLLKLASSMDGDAMALQEKLSSFATEDSLTKPQQRPFNRMGALLRKQIEATSAAQPNGDLEENSKHADDDKSNTETFGDKVISLQTSKIDPSPYPHRLEDSTNAAEINDLRSSMEADGQDIPIVVRPHPDLKGRYQVVCGSRRLIAAKETEELSIKAIVKDLGDIELLTTQGRENSFRRDASYIEKVRLAAHIFKMVPNYDQAKKLVMSALSIDHTEASRLKAISERFPNDMIESIGAAPKIGRNRWLDLANLVAKSQHLKTARQIIQSKTFTDLTSSDDRFLHLIKEIEAKPSLPEPTTLMSGNTKLGKLVHRAKYADIQMPDREFAELVAEKLPELYEKFKNEPEWLNG